MMFSDDVFGRMAQWISDNDDDGGQSCWNDVCDEITRLRAALAAANADAADELADLRFARDVAINLGAAAHDARIKAEAERDAARAVLRALLDADEHGQGVAWQEAMDRAHAMIQTQEPKP